MVGDTVGRGTPLRVRVTGAPGAFVRVIADHGAVAFGPVPVTSASFQRRVMLPHRSHWAYAEVYGEDAREQREGLCDGTLGGQTSYCRDRIAALAMTSAMYFR
jgi:hypothetical protein